MTRTVVVALALLASPSALAGGEGEAKKPKIAILEVRSTGLLDPKTFEGIAPLLATELAEERSDLQIVSAADIKAMIGFEREKQLLGCSEGACLAEIGGALGVQHILSTEATKLGGTFVISMALIDVSTQKVLKRVSRRTERESKLVDTCIDEVEEIAKAIPAGASEPKRGAVRPETPRPEEKREVGVEAIAATPAPARSKIVTGVVLGSGALALLLGTVLDLSAWQQHALYEKGEITRQQAVDARNGGVTGVVLGTAGVGLLTWGLVRVISGHAPASPPQVVVVPASSGGQAAVTIALP